VTKRNLHEQLVKTVGYASVERQRHSPPYLQVTFNIGPHTWHSDLSAVWHV